MSDFLAEVQQQRESRRREGKAQRTGRRQAVAGQRGAAAPDAATQARKARRMETEAAMLRRRAMAPEAGADSAAATDSVEEQRSPISTFIQVPQGSVRITAGRKRPASSADQVPATPLPPGDDRHGHHDASEPDAVSDSSRSDSSDERSGSLGVGDGSDADSASAFEFVSVDAGRSGALERQDGGTASARLQQSGPQQRSITAAPPGLRQARSPCAAGPARAAAEPQIDAGSADDSESGVPLSMRKLRRSALRRSRELLELRRGGLEPAAAAAGRDDADAVPAAPDIDPATGSDAAGGHAEQLGQNPDSAVLGSRPASAVHFWLYPRSRGCGMPPGTAEATSPECLDARDLDSEQREAANLASLGANFAAQLLGAQHRHSRWIGLLLLIALESLRLALLHCAEAYVASTLLCCMQDLVCGGKQRVNAQEASYLCCHPVLVCQRT